MFGVVVDLAEGGAAAAVPQEPAFRDAVAVQFDGTAATATVRPIARQPLDVVELEGEGAALARREYDDAGIDRSEVQSAAQQLRYRHLYSLPVTVPDLADALVAAGAGEDAVDLHGHAGVVVAVVVHLDVEAHRAGRVGTQVDAHARLDEPHAERFALGETHFEDLASGRIAGGDLAPLHLVVGVGAVRIVDPARTGVGGVDAPVPNPVDRVDVDRLRFARRRRRRSGGHNAAIGVADVAADDPDVVDPHMGVAGRFEHEEAQHPVEVDGTAAEVARVVRNVADLHGDGRPRIPGQRIDRQIDEAEVREAAVELDLQAARRVGLVAEYVQVELHFARVATGVRRAAHAEKGLSGEVRGKYGNVAAAGGVDIDHHAAVAGIDFRERERAPRVVDAEVERHAVFNVRERKRTDRIDVEVVDRAVDVTGRGRRNGWIRIVRKTVATCAGLGIDGAFVNADVVDE